MRISRNIFGLDLENLSWLKTEWEGYANWSNAVARLQQFKDEQILPRRMGEMSGAIAIFNGISNVIDQNIIHLDFDANVAGGMAEDHLIYSIRETKIAITRNWLSGHPNTAGGGLKHRDTNGPGVIAANYLNDTPLLLYSYGDTRGGKNDHLYPFDNQLIFRNYLKVTRVLPLEITGGSSRYGFNFMSTDGNTGRNIDVAENLFDLAPNINNQGINLAQGKTTADGWRIYKSNRHVGGVNAGELVEIRGRNQTPGAYTYSTVDRELFGAYLSNMEVNITNLDNSQALCCEPPLHPIATTCGRARISTYDPTLSLRSRPQVVDLRRTGNSRDEVYELPRLEGRSATQTLKAGHPRSQEKICFQKRQIAKHRRSSNTYSRRITGNPRWRERDHSAPFFLHAIG